MQMHRYQDVVLNDDVFDVQSLSVYISQKINRLASKDNQSVDTDEVISEIGTAMENLLEKDENGFSWDLENKVKKEF